MSTPTREQKARARDRIRAIELPKMERSIAKMENDGKVRDAKMMRWAMDELLADNGAPWQAIRRLVRVPVTIEEFCESKEFVGALEDFRVWPAWQDELRKMNPDVIVGEPPVHEVVLGGGTGTGKTTTAWLTTAYQFYLFTCFDPITAPYPHLSGALTPIKFPLMSLKPTITKTIIYDPLRTLITSMPYVLKNMTWDKRKEGVMHFSNGIIIEPVLAMGESMQGAAIPGGIFDEMAFMSVIEQSKQVPGPRGQGGKFDQAQLVYDEARSRRSRSFKTKGVSIGTLCFMSNTRYQGDFMDRCLAGLKEKGRSHVYFRRLKRYDVAPADVAAVRGGDTIRLLVGSDTHNSRVLRDDEAAGVGYPALAQVEDIPSHYLEDATENPDQVLRDVCGISTGAISPFFARRDKIDGGFVRGRRLSSWVDKSDVDLAVDGLPIWVEENMPDDRDTERFLHVDLSISHDRCGVAVVKIAGFENMGTDDPNLYERAPHYEVEVAVTITPRANFHVDPSEVRTWLMELGTRYGFNIGGVSYDGFQSDESRQRWRRSGVLNVREISMDRTSMAFDHFRTALYQDRVDFVASDMLRDEMNELEYNAQRDKVDHPPKGSKDLADAVAGALQNAVMSRGVRREGAYVDSSGERVRVRRQRVRGKERQRPQGRRK